MITRKLMTRKKLLTGLVAGSLTAGWLVAPSGSAFAFGPPPGYTPDPAHHSTDVNDPDPAHHRPYWVNDNGTWKLVPVPGFDFNGYPVNSSTSTTTPALPPGYNYDPAHHSLDKNDPDPAHHRPILVFSASTNEWVLTPLAGFDINGYPLEGSTPGTTVPAPPDGYNYDPAHHSTDVNDPDPAHHRPYRVYEGGEWRLVPIPGFDLNGYPIERSIFS